MNLDFQFDVFLSHSAKDKAVVRPLAERLRQDGLKVWFDEWFNSGHWRLQAVNSCGRAGLSTKISAKKRRVQVS